MGASATPTGLSPTVEPASSLDGSATSIPSAGGFNWTPRVVQIWRSWECGRYLAFKTSFYGPWHLSDDGGKTSIFTDEYLQEVMARAQAIEARRAETGTGSVPESAVPKGCAQ